MNAHVKPPIPMTVHEFLAWEPGDGRKWELVDGEHRAMAPAKPTHAFLQHKMAALRRNRLLAQGSTCRSATEPGIVPGVQAGHNVLIPDLVVTYTPGDGDDEGTISASILIVEIMSPSDQAETWKNVRAYTSVATVQEILILRSTRVGADLLRRGPAGAWPADPSAVESGDLVLDSIGCRMPLADVYRTTRLYCSS